MRFIRLTLITGMALSAMGGVLNAQQAAKKYKELPVAVSFTGNSTTARSYRQKLQSQVMGVLRGQYPMDGTYQLPNKDKTQVTNRNLLDAWLGLYLLPRMTQVSNLDNVARERNELFARVIAQARDQAHKHVVDTVFTTMSQVAASEEFHPAVRYNAMLTLSRLNEVESASFQAPKPLPQATVFLLQQYQNAKNDGMRLGAMVGILRHVQLDRISPFMDPAQKAQVLNLAMALLNQADPPAGRTRGGHTWLQRRAIDLLAALGTPQGGVADKITGIIGDEKAPLSLRLTAAQSLASLNLDPSVQIDAVGTAHKMGQLAVMACREEAARVAERKQREADAEARAKASETIGSGGDDLTNVEGGGGAEEMAKMFEKSGGGGGDIGGPSIELLTSPERRIVYHTTLRIRSQLYAIYQGLGSARSQSGLFKVASDAPAQQTIKRLADDLVAIVHAMDGKPDPKVKDPPPLKAEMDVDAVLKAVDTKVIALENTLPAKQVPPQTPPTAKKGPIDPAQLLKGG